MSDHVQEKTAQETRLRPNRLGSLDALAQSIGLLALEMGIALSVSFVAGAAGRATPLAYLVAGLASLFLAYVFVRFSERLPHAGGLYAYISHSLGSRIGFLGGWMYGGAFMVGVSFTLAIASVFAATLFEHAGLSIHWSVIFLVLLVLLAACALFDVRFSTRIELVLSAAGAIAVLSLAFLILVRGGANGLSLAPFSLTDGGLSPLFFAVLFAFTSFIGFESSTVLGEETVEARRAIPRALLIALVLGLLFYVLVSYSVIIGYGIPAVGQLAQDPAPFDTLAARYGGPLLAIMLDLIVAISAFTASLAGLNLAARMLFAMGREKQLPPLLGRTHTRYGTPIVALSVVLAVTLVLGTTLGLLLGPFLFYGFLATAASFLILLAYMLVALSWSVFTLQTRKENEQRKSSIIDIVLPLFALLICGATLVSSLFPVPPPPLRYAPYVAGLWILVGTILLFVQRQAPSHKAFERQS